MAPRDMIGSTNQLPDTRKISCITACPAHDRPTTCTAVAIRSIPGAVGGSIEGMVICEYYNENTGSEEGLVAHGPWADIDDKGVFAWQSETSGVANRVRCAAADESR
ncbi:hypothetical protein MTP03_46700 [Tsukamurella sp. PLM1]|nr:hypothetical protein MTP03_46700 [Tsukamurella sp. PLM1]